MNCCKFINTKFVLIIIVLFTFFENVKAQNQFSKNKNAVQIWKSKENQSLNKIKVNKQNKIIFCNAAASVKDSNLFRILKRYSKNKNYNIRSNAFFALGQMRDSNLNAFFLNRLKNTVYETDTNQVLPALGKSITKLNSQIENLIINVPITIQNSNSYFEMAFWMLNNGIDHPVFLEKWIEMASQNQYSYWMSNYISRRKTNPAEVKTLKHLVNGISINLTKINNKITNDTALHHCIYLTRAISKLKNLKSADTLFLKNFIENINICKLPIPLRAELIKLLHIGHTNIEPVLEKISCLYYSNISHLENTNLIDMVNKFQNFNPYLVSYMFVKTPVYFASIFNTKLNNIEKSELMQKIATHDTILLNAYFQNNNIEGVKNIYQSILKSNNAYFRTTLCELFIERIKGISDYLQNVEIHQMLINIFKLNDPSCASLIALNCVKGDLSIDLLSIQDIDFALNSFKIPQDLESYNDVLKLKCTLNNSIFEAKKDLQSKKTDWNYIKTMSSNEILTVKTNKGNFKIQLHVNEAPASVSYIHYLAKQGFYNAKSFHRLVPNFVIQGGCPRGDGYGGTDYTLNSEYSALPYQFFTVGLASSGTNTESCQWFVTHIPTPNLNGRYTVIGTVVDGFSVIYQLGIGDSIISVE